MLHLLPISPWTTDMMCYNEWMKWTLAFPLRLSWGLYVIVGFTFLDRCEPISGFHGEREWKACRFCRISKSQSLQVFACSAHHTIKTVPVWSVNSSHTLATPLPLFSASAVRSPGTRCSHFSLDNAFESALPGANAIIHQIPSTRHSWSTFDTRGRRVLLIDCYFRD